MISDDASKTRPRVIGTVNGLTVTTGTHIDEIYDALAMAIKQRKAKQSILEQVNRTFLKSKVIVLYSMRIIDPQFRD